MDGQSGSELFSSAAADQYDRWVGRYSRQLARAQIAIAGVRSGERALDVGCGPGPLTAELVAVLGAHGVSAIDPSPPFVEACRLRNPGSDVRLATAEDLPFASGTFDHALSQLVVNFMTDALAGVSEMKRVTRDGGTVTSAVWDYRGQMTLLRTFWDAAVATDARAGERDEGRAMGYCTPDELLQLWSRVGLDELDVSAAVVSATYAGFEDLWAPVDAGVGPVGVYVATLSADHRAAVKQEYRRRLGVGDAPFELTARAWIVTGRKVQG